MLRLLHFADLHLEQHVGENYGPVCSDGVPSRLKEQGRVWDEAVTHAIEAEVDLFLFAGDAFRCQNPSSTALNLLQAPVQRLTNAGIPFVAVTGNHDWGGVAGENTALDYLRGEGVYIFSRPGVEVIYRANDGEPFAVVVGVPYFRRSHLLAQEPNLSREEADHRCAELATEIIAGLTAEALSYGLPILCLAHHNVEGATLSGGYETAGAGDPFIPLRALDRDEFLYVALGHIHKQQRVAGAHRHVWFAGSPMPLDFGEAKEDKKGFIVADFSDTGTLLNLATVETSHRKLLNLTFDFTIEGPEHEYRRQVRRACNQQRAEGAVVKVAYQCRREQRPGIDHAEIDAILRAHGIHHLHSITPTLTDAGVVNRVDGITGTDLSPRGAVAAYLAADPSRFPAPQQLLTRLDQLLTKESPNAISA